MYKAKSLAALLILFTLVACSGPVAGLMGAPLTGAQRAPGSVSTATATAYVSVTPTPYAGTASATPTAYVSVTPTPYAGTAADTATVTVTVTPFAPGEGVSTLATPGSISVSGEAVVKVAPDTVVLTLGVETLDNSLATSKKNNDDIVKKVLALADAAGVGAKDIQTDYVNIEPLYDQVSSKRTFMGYYVRKTIAITLHDLTKFDGLLGDSLEAGVNYVHGVEFSTSDLRKYRDQARSLALQAAQEKAAAMAKDLGRSVGAAVKVNEDRNYFYSGYSSYWGGGYSNMSQNVVQNAGNAPAIEGALAPGMVSVTADVTVEFELR
jgi:uncharacterized protein